LIKNIKNDIKILKNNKFHPTAEELRNVFFSNQEVLVELLLLRVDPASEIYKKTV